MSTILKALRRVEEGRSTHVQRPLREEVAGTGPRLPVRARGRRLLLATLALGVGVVAGVVAFWSATQREAPPGVAASKPEAVVPVPALPRIAPAAEAESIVFAEPPPRLSPERADALPSYAEPVPAQRELSAAALASPVERVDRPPAGPRIADPDAQEQPRRTAAAGAFAPRPVRRVPPDEMPGQHRQMTPAVPEPAEAAVTVALPRASAPTPPAEPPAPSVGEASGISPIAEPASEASHSPVVAPRPGPPEGVAEPAEVTESVAPQAPAPPGASEAPAGPAVVRIVKAEPAGPVEPVPAASESAPDREESSGGQALARSEVPGVRVERTSWHPQAERRSALVVVGDVAGRREIHEGDAVGPLVVSTIKPSGVIFLHEGVEIVRRVGEP
jgi:hypothetical protein